MTKYFINFLIIMVSLTFLGGCTKENGDNEKDQISQKDIAYLPQNDAEIQRYNIEIRKKQTLQRFPCDTISLMEFVLDNFPEGSYLVTEDRTSTYELAEPAVLYYPSDRNYVFGVVARSKPGERLIEVKNIVGYDQSYIDLDSTELGTAFFYLVLFKCENGFFKVIWETPIPSHGGYNYISIQKWHRYSIDFIKTNFHYAQGVGNISYNYFLVDGLEKAPHLLMTYEGINFKRTIADVNYDRYPDYFEHIYYDDGSRITPSDSIPFIWNQKDSVYQNLFNKKHTRPY
ncbi:MAG: hypothetical protein HXY50_15030 [Ignavibacteriaceae bacterium]|nr:hypothetical protein [Ignavibacteriaceae bacterium]